MRLARELGLLDGPGVRTTAADAATDEELALVHDRAYVDAVRYASEHPRTVDLAHGLGTSDDLIASPIASTLLRALSVPMGLMSCVARTDGGVDADFTPSCGVSVVSCASAIATAGAL